METDVSEINKQMRKRSLSYGDEFFVDCSQVCHVSLTNWVVQEV